MSQQTSNHSFDELASGLASGTLSRGKALKLMGAALVGGTLASLGIGEAAADDECRPDGKKCRQDAQCCNGNCSKSGTSRFGTCAAACVSNGGACTSDNDCCSRFCVDRSCAEPRALFHCICEDGSATRPCVSDCGVGQVVCQDFCTGQGSSVGALSFCEARTICI